jgi:hypothetical protein
MRVHTDVEAVKCDDGPPGQATEGEQGDERAGGREHGADGQGELEAADQRAAQEPRVAACVIEHCSGAVGGRRGQDGDAECAARSGRSPSWWTSGRRRRPTASTRWPGAFTAASRRWIEDNLDVVDVSAQEV